MELIDRYLYAVTSRLPENIREDVEKELKANIEDMLPENPSKADVSTVLKKLGNPVKLADEYRQVKRYLIGPGLYDNYLTLLKLVISITSLIFVLIALIEGIIGVQNGDIFGLGVRTITKIITAALEGSIQGALWVTLIFAILEKSGINEGAPIFGKRDWSPEDLPLIPKGSKKKISRSETTFSMILLVCFISILYFQPQFISIYTKDQTGITTTTPLFVNERLGSYIIIIILLTFTQFGILIYKFITAMWSIPLAIINTIHNILSALLICIMAADASLINPEFILKLSNLTKLSLIQINEGIFRGTSIFVIVFIGISLWDSIQTFIKLKK
jgi:hypothetical protein